MYKNGTIKAHQVLDTPVRPDNFREISTCDDSDDSSEDGSNINKDDARKAAAAIMNQATGRNNLIFNADDSDDPEFKYEVMAITKWEVRKGKAWFEVQWNNGKQEPGEYKHVMVNDKNMLNEYLAKNNDALDYCVKHHKHRQPKFYEKGNEATMTKPGGTATTTKAAKNYSWKMRRYMFAPRNLTPESPTPMDQMEGTSKREVTTTSATAISAMHLWKRCWFVTWL